MGRRPVVGGPFVGGGSFAASASRWPFSLLLLQLLLCTCLAAGHLADSALEGKSFDVTRDTREWFRILHVDDDYLLVGGKDVLYNVSLDSMTGNVSIVIQTDERALRTCRTSLWHFFGQRPGSCVNYVRTAIKVDEGRFFVCGSNSGTSRCYRYEYDGKENAWLLTIYQPDYNSPPFAPLFPWMNFTVLKTSENVLYTGGSLFDYSQRLSHVVFRNGSADGRLEPLLSSRMTETTVHALRIYRDGNPEDARIYPNFVASFETAEYVYWLFSEPALELQPFTFMVTSRVARVCKNDMSNDYANVGEYTWRLSTFSTYWKARLDCSVPGKHSGFSHYAYDQLGYNSFYFNVIGGATPLHNGSIYPRPHGLPPTPIMYGVFNTDRNSIRGSAICAYDNGALTAPFSGPLYLLDSHDPHMLMPTGSSWTWTLHSFETGSNKGKPHPAQCTNDTRAKDPSDVYPRQAMVAESAKPITNRPLFIQTDHSYLMTHIVVDWQVRALDGRYYDVLFIGTDHGTILKIVNIGGDNAIAFTIIENRTVTEGLAIGEMRLVDRGHRKVMLVNTFESVRQIAVERCSQHNTCTDCVALRDPYCSWDLSTSQCVATYDGTQSANVQNIGRGADTRCPVIPAAANGSPSSVAAISTLPSAVEPEQSRTSAAKAVSDDGNADRASTVGKMAVATLSDSAGSSATPAAGDGGKLAEQRASSSDSPEFMCPNCIYIVPTAVAVASLIIGFGIGWLCRTYCYRVPGSKPKLSAERQDSTVPLADQQCLLKVNNAEKDGGLLAVQSSKVYV